MIQLGRENPAPTEIMKSIREQFPILTRTVHGKPLIYFDNAATTQKPRAVIDALVYYYENLNANIHRGVHTLSQEATDAHETARQKIANFLGAAHAHEIIFTRGTTESINLVAATWARSQLREGDEIIISALEHHSNIVPWQMLRDEKNIKLRVIPIDDNGELIFEEYQKLLNEKTRLVAVGHVSNALGTINPVREIIQLAHAAGAKVLLDGAQAAPHIAINVQDLDCDFYAFSGHKIYGPTGIGVLYGKTDLLEAMPPYQGGGEMISSVTFEKSTWNVLPFKFEAGTPNIAGAIGLGTAIDFVHQIGLDVIAAHEYQLLKDATAQLQQLPGLRIVGNAPHKAAVVSFVVKNQHPNDIGMLLDTQGIAVRTGHHCAQPVMDRYDIPATTRASFALYNTREEVAHFAAALQKVLLMLS
jgi:cysteine desulfurase/selenocysteine lyase